MFDREGALSGSNNTGPVQIIRYNYSENDGFSSLVGLSQQNDQIVGNIQLVSLKLQKSQFIKGYYSTFGFTQVHQGQARSDIFCFTEKEGLAGKITISQLSKQGALEKFKKVISFVYP